MRRRSTSYLPPQQGSAARRRAGEGLLAAATLLIWMIASFAAAQPAGAGSPTSASRAEYVPSRPFPPLAATPLDRLRQRAPARVLDRLPLPTVQVDADDTVTPLDLKNVSFGAVDRDLELRVQTFEPFELGEVVAGGPRSLCVFVEARTRPIQRYRLCLVRARAAAHVDLSVSKLSRSGVAISHSRLPADVRASERDLSVRFSAASSGLPVRAFTWHVVAAWPDHPACAAAAPDPAAPPPSCVDRAPDTGERAGRVYRPVPRGCVPGGASYRTRGLPTRRQVALTFDDGPGVLTPRFLSALSAAHAPATFFVVGQEAGYRAELLRRMLDQGHAIGNHTYAHADASRADARVDADLTRTTRAITAATGGYRPCIFRPPYGRHSRALFELARRKAMLTIEWDVDTNDWRRPGSPAILSRALGGVRPGSIILMHDSGGPRTQTLAALPRIIAGLRRRGYELVTVPELLGLRERWAYAQS